MKSLILLLFTIFILVGCNQTENKSQNRHTVNTTTDIDSPMTSDNELSPIYDYDYNLDSVIQVMQLPNDTVSTLELIAIINANNNEDIKIDFVNQSHDTVFVKINDATYLTQRIGSAGANAILAIATYTLTELNNVNYVHFTFEEGDHAMPGTYSRKYFQNQKIKLTP